MGSHFDINEAQSQFLKLLERVSKGEEIIIARNGEPIARLTPLESEPKEKPRGISEGQIWVAPDFNETSQEITDLFEQGDVYLETTDGNAG